ncbi:MAG: UDP-N-acetylmuramyl-tripeptide synthetase [Oligoflexia bacterium]|nr:UDP-N-acetylmuramyl-tripeptide synthetase [Oligoflexia bacterium]
MIKKTKQEIIDLLSSQINIIDCKFNNKINENNKKNENIELCDIEWKIENSQTNKVLFYHLHNQQKSIEEFYNRLRHSFPYGLLIINAVSNLHINIETSNTLIIDEKDFLKAQKILLDLWYPLELQNKKLVAITGTNGKTTSVFLCQQIANQANIKAAALGTLGLCEDGKTWSAISSGLTTPPLIELQKILHHIFHVHDHEVCFMEVSSHAVATQRIYGLEFDLVAFTNLTQDHLDFHKDMNDYFLAKLDIAKKYLKKNNNGKEGIFLVSRNETELIKKINQHDNNIVFNKTSAHSIPLTQLPAFLQIDFNQSNLELALDINYFINGITLEKHSIDLTKLIPADGRFVVCNFGNKTQIIDFAHSPDAIEKIALTARKIYANKKIIILFGCGGDRDRSKRPIMGQIVSKYADELYVTSDNSRFENPQSIIDDILPGITKNSKYKIIVDREQAVEQAYLNSSKEDVLLLLGKGHEQYLDVLGIKYEYSDLYALKRGEAMESILSSIQNTSTISATTISTDTRTIKANEIFIALNGENFRGIDFIEQALEKKASMIIYDEQKGRVSTHINDLILKHEGQTKSLKVNDTLVFLQNLAKTHTQNWFSKKNNETIRKIIGITGTNGKTTHKEMLFHLLDSITILNGKILATEKNYNNHVGVPKTLLKLNDSFDLAIIEMGSNHPGEIKLLADLTGANAGIITNIGDGHLEFFGNRENVLYEKRALFDQIMLQTNNDGLFVLKASDPLLCKLPLNKNVLFYKEENEPSYIDNNKIFANCKFDAKNSSITIKNYTLKNENIIGKHNFENLAATFILAHSLFPNYIDQLIEAAATYRPKENRSLWVQGNFKPPTTSIATTKHFFMDAYNANPSSMKASLQGFYQHLKDQLSIDPTTQFYVLGDMNELGENAKSLHIEVGQLLKSLDIKATNIAFIGRYSKYYLEGFSKHALALESKVDFENNYWSQILEKYNYFFIKASRSVEFETLLHIKNISI